MPNPTLKGMAPQCSQCLFPSTSLLTQLSTMSVMFPTCEANDLPINTSDKDTEEQVVRNSSVIANIPQKQLRQTHDGARSAVHADQTLLDFLIGWGDRCWEAELGQDTLGVDQGVNAVDTEKRSQTGGNAGDVMGLEDGLI